MFRLHVRQLKNLRRFPVPQDVLEAGRVKLIAVIEASPMASRPSVWFLSAAWRPVMAMMIVIVVATGGGTVVAAHDALPGEALYVVKLAAEDVRERLTITQDQRFVVQAAHATRRLEEAEQLLALQGLEGQDRATRVRTVMDRYEDHVFRMNEIAVKMEPDPKKPKNAKKAVLATEDVLDRHVRLIESATRAGSAVASMMLDRIDAAVTMEADVYSAIPADDGGVDEGGVERRSERAKKIEERVKRMRAQFEERRRSSEREDDEAGDREEPHVEDGGSDAWVGSDTDFGTRVEKPLEIRFGM